MRSRLAARTFALLCLHLPLFAACSDPIVSSIPRTALPAAPAPRYAKVLLEGAPHVRQKPDFCGEACVEMALARLGKRLSQDQVFALTGVDPALGRGAYTKEMITALGRIGFAVGPVYHQVEVARADAQLGDRFAELHADLLAGVPSIVCMRYDERPRTTEHFRLVLGYDDATDEVVYHEPAVDGGGHQRMKRARFLSLWPLKYESSRWTLIRMRLDPAPMNPGAVGSPPVAVNPALLPALDTRAAALSQHVMALRDKLPPGFSLTVASPFVVVGDESAEVVRSRAERTVAWAVAKLKQDFFTADPKEILDVWLFKNKKSYEAHTKAIFDHKPSTPYGYYSSEHKALIMNIATGGGTLVHEIVHPFVEADFPGAPAWLNEGLGSLFEQSGEEDGHIVGYPNWRLPGLKEAIKRRAVPSFKALTATTDREFYDEDPGSNYAQARYLCYYLQQHGKLTRFYKELRAARAEDPTGYATLQKVLGEPDMDAFKVRWEAWVMRLSFP